ncbi:MAG: hypothetical protein J6S67_11125 [Methanobrevibacter sp.]|nr:hypothetical protein [Methanobrevibacter sp.]
MASTGAILEAKRCYDYILRNGPTISELAAQRAIWNIYQVEVGGYDRKKDTEKKKRPVSTACQDELHRITHGG